MNNYPFPIIAREGWVALGLAVALALIATYFLGGWSTPFWIIAALVLQYFRDPGRVIPQQPDIVVAPADGRIIAIEKAHDPYAERAALKVGVFMSIFNVHSNRAPVDGMVNQIQTADSSAAIAKSVRTALVMTAANGAIVTCVQLAGQVAGRILCYAKQGEIFTRGQRYGFIRFGSRVDVYLPLHAILKVAVGDKVRATETVLAKL